MRAPGDLKRKLRKKAPRWKCLRHFGTGEYDLQ